MAQLPRPTLPDIVRVRPFDSDLQGATGMFREYITYLQSKIQKPKNQHYDFDIIGEGFYRIDESAPRHDDPDHVETSHYYGRELVVMNSSRVQAFIWDMWEHFKSTPQNRVRTSDTSSVTPETSAVQDLWFMDLQTFAPNQDDSIFIVGVGRPFTDFLDEIHTTDTFSLINETFPLAPFKFQALTDHPASFHDHTHAVIAGSDAVGQLLVEYDVFFRHMLIQGYYSPSDYYIPQVARILPYSLGSPFTKNRSKYDG